MKRTCQCSQGRASRCCDELCLESIHETLVGGVGKDYVLSDMRSYIVKDHVHSLGQKNTSRTPLSQNHDF